MSDPAPSSAPAATGTGTGATAPAANNNTEAPPRPLITGLAHINLTVPTGTLDAARAFYGTTLGFAERPVPAAQTHELAWFDIGGGGDGGGGTQPPPQQVHVAVARGPDDANAPAARRHPCFRLADAPALATLRARVADHRARGGAGAPLSVEDDAHPAGAYPARFFARDFAGNRLEFSL